MPYYGPSLTLSWIYDIAETFDLSVDRETVTAKAKELKQYIFHYKMMIRKTACRNPIVYSDYDTAVGMTALLGEL